MSQHYQVGVICSSIIDGVDIVPKPSVCTAPIHPVEDFVVCFLIALCLISACLIINALLIGVAAWFVTAFGCFII